MKSSDERLASIAAKSHKETLYHMKWSGDWVIRLGDGTEESHNRIQQSVNELWSYKDEIISVNAVDQEAEKAGYGVSLELIKEKRNEKIKAVLEEATLTTPEGDYAHKGGKEGTHSEHLGFILADLQFLQRAYPGNEW